MGSKRSDKELAEAIAHLEAALDPLHDGDPNATVSKAASALQALDLVLGARAKTRQRSEAERRLQEARGALRDHGPNAVVAAREALAIYRKAYGVPVPPKPRIRYGLEETLADHPLPKTICRRLEWDVGRPPMLIGAPGAAKTYATQQAVIDLVLGRGLWGCPEFRPPGPCRVLHVDFDQGKGMTLRRYKRLLRGAGVQAEDPTSAREELALIAERRVGELGSYQVDPGEGLKLSSLDDLQRWKGAWLEAVTGFDAVFVDSLRRLAPFLDENDSKFSIVPDTLREVSEERNVVIVLIHHATNKSTSATKGAAPGSRGSSAIDAASGTQLSIERQKQGRKVVQIRSGEAAELEPFFLAFEAHVESGVPTSAQGVRIVYKTIEQARGPEKESKAAALVRTKERVLGYIAETNAKRGYGPLKTHVAQHVEGKAAAIYAALDELIAEGAVQERKDAKLMRLWARGEHA